MYKIKKLSLKSILTKITIIMSSQHKFMLYKNVKYFKLYKLFYSSKVYVIINIHSN